MIIRVIERARDCRYFRYFEPANEVARIVASLTRRPLLDEQDLVYLKKLGHETEVVSGRE